MRKIPVAALAAIPLSLALLTTALAAVTETERTEPTDRKGTETREGVWTLRHEQLAGYVGDGREAGADGEQASKDARKKDIERAPAALRDGLAATERPDEKEDAKKEASDAS